jgi:hypothetical protein
MRRMMLASAVTGTAMVAGYGSATAQVVIETQPADVYVATPYSYDSDYYTYRSRPRVYGYTRYYRDVDEDDVVVRPRYREGCGAYRYWNGSRCVSTRY